MPRPSSTTAVEYEWVPVPKERIVDANGQIVGAPVLWDAKEEGALTAQNRRSKPRAPRFKLVPPPTKASTPQISAEQLNVLPIKVDSFYKSSRWMNNSERAAECLNVFCRELLQYHRLDEWTPKAAFRFVKWLCDWMYYAVERVDASPGRDDWAKSWCPSELNGPSWVPAAHRPAFPLIMECIQKADEALGGNNLAFALIIERAVGEMPSSLEKKRSSFNTQTTAISNMKTLLTDWLLMRFLLSRDPRVFDVLGTQVASCHGIMTNVLTDLQKEFLVDPAEPEQRFLLTASPSLGYRAMKKEEIKIRQDFFIKNANLNLPVTHRMVWYVHLFGPEGAAAWRGNPIARQAYLAYLALGFMLEGEKIPLLRPAEPNFPWEKVLGVLNKEADALSWLGIRLHQPLDQGLDVGTLWCRAIEAFGFHKDGAGRYGTLTSQYGQPQFIAHTLMETPEMQREIARWPDAQKIAWLDALERLPGNSHQKAYWGKQSLCLQIRDIQHSPPSTPTRSFRRT